MRTILSGCYKCAESVAVVLPAPPQWTLPGLAFDPAEHKAQPAQAIYIPWFAFLGEGSV